MRIAHRRPGCCDTSQTGRKAFNPRDGLSNLLRTRSKRQKPGRSAVRSAPPEGSSIGHLSALETLDWGAVRQVHDEEDEQVQAKG